MEPWTFHIGSCAMKVWPFYLWTFSIFNTMNSRPSDFMIWTGDHIYMLKPWQWDSEIEMKKAYASHRNVKPLKNYLNSRPQYAIWDDHDYGPNNSGTEFEQKDTSLKVFKEMWPMQNQAAQKGIYFTFIHKEAQFFMLDGRYFKIPEETLLGDEQMMWLLEELKKSTSTFKFIVSGIQILADSDYENLRKYPKQYDQLMTFIEKEKIEGIIFLSGDVHYSEASKIERPNAYDLYDFTFSPLTSFPVNYLGKNTNEHNNSKRNKRNFGEISFSGEPGARVCKLACIGRTGRLLWQYEIPEAALRFVN